MSDEFIIKHHDHGEDCCDVTFQAYKEKTTVPCYNEHCKKALASQLIEEAAKLLKNDHGRVSKVLNTLHELINEAY